MNCDKAHELILEADLEQLRGDGESPLAQHIRSCSRCSARASRILEGEAALASSLARHQPSVVADRAIVGARGQLESRRRRRNLWRAAIPALAAAGLVGVMLTRGGEPDGIDIPRLETEALPPTPDVQAPPDRDFAVFSTENPDIVIIWYF